jgi:hypothetical protein
VSGGKAWLRREEARLRKLYPNTPTPDIALRLGRSLPSVKSRAKVLRLRKNRNYHLWTAADEKVLRREYPHRPTARIAKKLGTTVLSTYQRANLIGLKKTPEFMAKLLKQCGQNVVKVGKAFRFKKGQVPPNKGLRRPGYSIGRGRMQETQFKKGTLNGHALQHYMPIGSTRLMDGYLQRKVSETGYPPRDWKGVHIILWEEAHGPVPASHAVCFKDGDRTHVRFDNLELLTRAELMLRNTIQNYPEPLKQVIRLHGKLKRKLRTQKEETGHAEEHDRGPAQSPVRHAGSAAGQREAHGD